MTSFVQALPPRATVATASRSLDLEVLTALRKSLTEEADVIELRLDSLNPKVEAPDWTPPTLPIPIITTARAPEEGGDRNLTAQARGELLRHALPYTDCIDTELASIQFPAIAKAIAAAHKAGVAVLLSSHDFQVTPELSEPRDRLTRAEDAGASIFKLATMLRSQADLDTLREFMTTPTSVPLSVMGMGELGKESRLALAAAGSILNYGYLRSPNAPGQWPAAELKKRLSA